MPRLVSALLFCLSQFSLADERTNILLILADNWAYPHAFASLPDTPKIRPCLDPGFAKRPKEELSHLPSDPDQIPNIASGPKFDQTLSVLRNRVNTWMSDTRDPRAQNPLENSFDQYRYFGGPAKKSK